MLLAFIWWSVLLYTKNKDAFQAKVEYWKIILVAEGEIKNENDFFQTPIYTDLYKKYKQQEWMIFGEATVFVISLIIGLWLINRGYNKQIDAAQQRRNFLLSITHELKSPLASIKLILETFLKRNLKKEQADKLSESALTETERLTNLVNDLLLAAKLETTYQPHVERIALDRMLGDILEKLQIKYPKISFSMAAVDTFPDIEADKTGITSVAYNLLENAVKYSPGASEIEVVLSRNGERIYWEVADQGVGIPDKEKQQVFERFYRVGNEDTRKTKGTGLGLYIVDQIIRAHEGKIEILDNQPSGSRFKITLPINQSL